MADPNPSARRHPLSVGNPLDILQFHALDGFEYPDTGALLEYDGWPEIFSVMGSEEVVDDLVKFGIGENCVPTFVIEGSENLIWLSMKILAKIDYRLIFSIAKINDKHSRGRRSSRLLL